MKTKILLICGMASVISACASTNPDLNSRMYPFMATTPTLLQVLNAGQSAGNKKITNLGNPTLAQDAMTKFYADANYQPKVSFTAGSVLFSGGTSVISQNNANFFWDNTNNRLGVGCIAASGTTLQANGVIATGKASVTDGSFRVYNGTNAFAVTIATGITSASYGLVLPASQGAVNTTLINNGAGVLSWGVPSVWALDGNTVGAEKYIGTLDAFDFPVRTSGIEQARFFSNGNIDIGDNTHGLFYDRSTGRVGQGTNSPTTNFHVSGVGNYMIKEESTGNSTGIDLVSSTNRTVFGVENNPFFIYDYTTSQYLFYFTNAGDIRLHDGRNTARSIDFTNNGNNGARLVIMTEGAAGANWTGSLQYAAIFGNATDAGAVNYPLQLAVGNKIEMTFGTNDDVAIGNNAPTQKFEVTGNVTIVGGVLYMVDSVAPFDYWTGTMTAGVLVWTDTGSPVKP